MTRTLQRSFLATTMGAIGFLGMVTVSSAQPGPGWGPGIMMGPGMGPGMMARGSHGRMCGPAAAGMAEWRIDRLERIIKPTDAQRSKLDELKATSAKSIEAMRATCNAELPATLTGRMEAMEKRLEAMLQSVKTLRPAFEAFYATLNDEQKQRLNASTGPGRFWRWRDRW